MTDENPTAEKVRKAIQKDYNYLAYNLPRYDKYKGSEKGYLKVGEEEAVETPPYSFTEMSDIMKKAFDELYKVKHVEPIGLRGETFYSDKKELEVLADAGSSTVTYRIRKREEE